VIAFDHYEKCAYLLCVTEPTSEDEGPALDRRDRRAPYVDAVARAGRARAGAGDALAEFYLSRSHQHYLEDIARVKRYLYRGRELRGSA